MDEISKNQIKFVSELNISEKISHTQGKLSLVKYNNKLYVEKEIVFLDDEIYSYNIETLKNLNKNKKILPNNICIPECLVIDGKRYVSFLQPYLEGENLINVLYNEYYSVREQIKYLEQIGLLLERLKNVRKENNIEFYINDLHESNIIVYKDEIKIIDTDTCIIDNDYAYKAKYLTDASLIKYTKNKYKINNKMTPGYIIANKQSDLFCYNIIILNYLFGKYYGRESVNYFDISKYNDFLNYLYKIGISYGLIESFDKVISYENNINPYKYLCDLKEEQVILARKYRENNRFK